MSKRANSFLTVGYKDGYIHTNVSADGKSIVEAQVSGIIAKHNTVIGAKRWITSVMRKPHCPTCKSLGYATREECGFCP